MIVPLPATVIDDMQGMNGSECRVYIYILRCTLGKHNESCKLAGSYLANGLEIPMRTVQRAMAKLKERGLVFEVETAEERGIFDVKEYRTKYKPVDLSLRAKRAKLIREDCREVIEYYKETCGRLAMKGRGVNRKDAARKIAKLIDQQKMTVSEIKDTILQYKNSIQFKADYVYSITNFFGEKAYYQSYRPTVILTKESGNHRATQCDASNGEHCNWQLGIKTLEWCQYCKREKIKW